MTFDANEYLGRATGRAKSDVANKLVSMFLHEVSRKICNSLGLRVGDANYTRAVTKVFGSNCCYCGKALEKDRAAVEHLDGMNRFRIGLHVPGNVILACGQCNREKRRDDQIVKLVPAESGWESFLSHNSASCSDTCKSCSYWNRIFDEPERRTMHLANARERIREFRDGYTEFLVLNRRARGLLREKMDAIYRECQHFATTSIKGAVDDVVQQLLEKKGPHQNPALFRQGDHKRPSSSQTGVLRGS